MWLSLSRSRIKLQTIISNTKVQSLVHSFINLHNRCLVSAAIAIIRGAEYSHYILFLRPIETLKISIAAHYLHHQLVSTRDQGEAVIMVEGFRDILSKRISCTTRRNPPSTAVVRVRPQQITHGTFMGDLLYSVQGTDVIQSVN